MDISVVGAGYVGLVSAACLADAGNRVLCIDTDAEKIAALKQGQPTIHEPKLAELVRGNAADGKLQFDADIRVGVAHGEVIFIAVGTPPDEDGAADLQYVLQVARDIGEHMTREKIVVIKSTVPVGTAQRVKVEIDRALKRRGEKIAFSVASNPEFLKEGAAVDDFMKPDRIIIGTADDNALAALKQIYAPFNRNHERVIGMDVASAELTKYAANAMLATKISFINEIANLAERLDADIESVRIGIGADPRIGYEFIYPGCGYGGSCFPKDIRALRRTAEANDYDARILAAVEAVNQTQKQWPAQKIVEHFGNDLHGKIFALWGLAFKPDTNDMREAPSRELLEELWRRGARVQAFDPAATAEARRIYGARDDLQLFSDDPCDALADADALIVVTEWRMFRAFDPARMRELMRGDVVIDARNIFSPPSMRDAGLTYYGVGRAKS